MERSVRKYYNVVFAKYRRKELRSKLCYINIYQKCF